MTFPQPSDDRAERILFAALDHPEEEREAFLANACDGDEELLTEIQALLAAHESAPSEFLASLDGLRFDSDAAAEPAIPTASNSANISDHPAPGANPDAQVPFIFGQRIAQGGMGAILEADDCKLDRKIAVKVMLREAGMDEVQKKRFIQEAAVLGRLEHPNIVPVHDLGRDAGGQLYYSMKLVKGRTLQDIINFLRDEDPDALDHYTLDRLLTIFRKICDALAFAHAENIIHRDLKPENIMVGEFGEVLVMDWGLSKILDGRDDLSAPESPEKNLESAAIGATLEGSVMGTPQYMSPEQAAGEIGEMDARSDIYSLGGILYTVLTLRPPVKGKDVFEILEKVQAGELTPLSEYGASTSTGRTAKATEGEVLEAKQIKPLPHLVGGRVPSALSSVAMKALALEKADRYVDVSELGEDIEKWQGGFATSAEEAGLGKQIALLIKRHKTAFATATTAWAIITALAVWFLISLQAKERRAVAEAERATTAEALAVQEKEIARAALAEASLLLADSALRESDLQSMLKALDAVPEDLRDATWKYLHEQSDTSILQINDGYVQCVAAHPTSPSVFAYAKPDAIKILNVRSGEILLEFDTSIPATFIAFSPDGEKIAVGTRTEGGGLAIHRTADGTLLKEWPAENSDYLEFNEDGSLLLQSVRSVRPQENSVQLWDALSGNLRWKTNFGRISRKSGRFVPGSGQVLYTDNSGKQDGTMFLSEQDGAAIETYDCGKITAFAVSRDGNLVVTSDEEGTLLSYLRNERKPVLELNQPGTISVHMALVPGHERFVQALEEKERNRPLTLELRDLETGEWRRSFTGVDQLIGTLSIHPLTGEVFVGGHQAKVWAGETPATWKMRTSEFRSGTFWGTDDLFLGPVSPEEYALLGLTPGGATELIQSFGSGTGANPTVSADGMTAMLTGNFGNYPLKLLKNPGPEPQLLAESSRPKNFFARNWRLGPKGERIAASTSYNTQAYILDARTGTVMVTLKPIDGDSKTQQVAWIRGGERVLGLTRFTNRGYSQSKHQIVVWDAATGEIVQSVAHPTLMDALSISPDGSRFAEAGFGKQIRIRDTETLEVLQEFRAHNDDISQLAWHPTLPVVASASKDYTVKIWNLDTGECLQVLRSLDSRPTALSFSPTGKRITCSDERYTRIWDLISADDPRLPPVSVE